MYYLRVRAHFSAAHKLNVEHQCKNVHGHNYRVDVIYAAKILNKEDMVLDAHDVKTFLNAVCDRLDHGMLNDYIDNPTAEKIAEYIYHQLSVLDSRVELIRVDVHETEGVRASYAHI